MKILMINVVCGIRSTGRICTDLAVALEAKGHEVKIAYGRENVPKSFEKFSVRIGSNLDVKLHGIKARLMDGAGFGSKSSTLKFIEWVKQYDPDIIHLHNIHGYYINVEVLFDYLRTCGKKIIWTLHDSWAFTGHTVYCDSVNCKKWENGCYKCPLVKEYPLSLLDFSNRNWKKKKEIFSNIPDMMIITPSEWLGKMTKKSFMGEYEIKVINNGIDTKSFYPRSSNFRKDNGLIDNIIILGVATSWRKMKGYDDFITLSHQLGDGFKVVLVGLTEDQLKKLPKNILGIERTSSIQELSEIYSAADLFVNLSYSENYPTVNIEAAACGTPVLTYNTGGSPEIVRKYGGEVVDRGDIKSVLDVIRNHLDDLKVNNTDILDTSDVVNLYLQKCYLE